MKIQKSKSTLKWIWTIAGKDGKKLLGLIFMTLLRGIEPALAAMTLRRVIDCAAGGDRHGLLQNFLLLGILTVIAIVLYISCYYLRETLCIILSANMKQKLFREIISRKFQNINARHSGEWMTLITSDVAIVAQKLVSSSVSAVLMVTRLLSALFALLMVLPQVSWFLIPGGILMVVISTKLRKVLRKMHRTIQELEGKIYAFLQEQFTGISVIKAFGKEAESVVGVEAGVGESTRQSLRRAKFLSFCNGCVSIAIRGIYLLGIVFSNLYVLNGLLSAGTMVAVLQLIQQAEAPLADIANAYPQFIFMLSSAERLMEIEKLPFESTADTKSPLEIQDFYANDLYAVGLRNAYFRYGPDPDVLHNLNFELHKGEFVAFTGKSGCGKSTTMKLLLNLYDLDSGQAYLLTKDGEEHPLTCNWRSLFAYIPQGNYLFSGTIRDTITFQEPIPEDKQEQAAQMERVRNAAEIACAIDFIDALADGFNTVLGEQGAGLSEGQMQRIAIARAIYSQRPILLLDEATSALDPATEAQVLHNIKHLTNKSVIAITHKSAALEICDRVVPFASETED